MSAKRTMTVKKRHGPRNLANHGVLTGPSKIRERFGVKNGDKLLGADIWRNR